MSLLTLRAALLALGCGLFLACVFWRLLAMLRRGSRNGGSRAREAAPATPVDAAIGVLQQKLESLEQEVQQLRRQGPAVGAAAVPRSGINLDKRSQALRMHRRGDQPADIAASLDLPLSEVNLLLKVHRIVLRSF